MSNNGHCIRYRIDRDVIALEGFDEGFGHAVGLRAADGRRTRLHADIDEQRSGIFCDEVRSVAGEPFNWLWKGVDETEAVLNSGDDKVLDVFALDALRCRDMCNGPAITAVESEGHADLFLVVAADFEPV